MMPSQEEMDREYQRELNAALQARLGDLGINPIPPEIERILAEQEEQLLRAAAAIAPATQAASYHLHQHRMEELRTLGRLGRSGRTPPVDHPREPATPQRDTGPPVLKPIAVEEREDLRPRAPATTWERPRTGPGAPMKNAEAYRFIESLLENGISRGPACLEAASKYFPKEDPQAKAKSLSTGFNYHITKAKRSP